MREPPESPAGQSFDAEAEDAGEAAAAFPWWVRALAVCHVLSLIGGPVGFAVLMAAAVWRWLRVGEANYDVLELGVAALACPVLCGAYRSWFERWGRERWPDGRYVARDRGE